MNHIFEQVADCVTTIFAAGEMERDAAQEILTVLACAMADEGWYAEAMDHVRQKYDGWPMVIKALNVALGE